MSIFPIIQPQIEEVPSLPIYKEIKWDYENNIPIFSNGEPVFVTGKEAVKVWAWKAIQARRYQHDIYSWNYGNEIYSLIGQNFTDDLKLAEATRYLKECLLVNPYIVDVTDIELEFAEDILKVSCNIITTYGEANLNV